MNEKIDEFLFIIFGFSFSIYEKYHYLKHLMNSIMWNIFQLKKIKYSEMKKKLVLIGIETQKLTLYYR